MTRRSKSAGVTLVQVSFTWHVNGGACANLEEARRWPFHVGHLLATAGFFAYITAPGSGPPRSPARSMQKEMRAPWLLAITRVATSLPKVAIAHLYLRSDHSAPRHFLSWILRIYEFTVIQHGTVRYGTVRYGSSTIWRAKDHVETPDQ